jgi:hypothetical protein
LSRSISDIRIYRRSESAFNMSRRIRNESTSASERATRIFDKAVLVTGTNRGIGQALVEKALN